MVPWVVAGVFVFLPAQGTEAFIVVPCLETQYAFVPCTKEIAWKYVLEDNLLIFPLPDGRIIYTGFAEIWREELGPFEFGWVKSSEIDARATPDLW